MTFPQTTRRPLAALLAFMFCVSLALPVTAASNPQVEAPPPPAIDPTEEMQPKFIWGLLLNMAFKFAMSAFTSWATNKITSELQLQDSSILRKLLLNASKAAIIPLARVEPPFGTKSAGGIDNVVVGEPQKELVVENGKENFQGAHVAIVAFDKLGAVAGIQPVTYSFRTGDRIKLKVLPTFDGLVVIENINPKGERQQIYPAKDSDVVKLKAGIEFLLPLGADEYFEFSDVTGDEQMVITIRDQRAFAGNASKVEANRKDDKTGSSFVQETPPGTFPVISQTLKLKHAS